MVHRMVHERNDEAFNDAVSEESTLEFQDAFALLASVIRCPRNSPLDDKTRSALKQFSLLVTQWAALFESDSTLSEAVRPRRPFQEMDMEPVSMLALASAIQLYGTHTTPKDVSRLCMAMDVGIRPHVSHHIPRRAAEGTSLLATVQDQLDDTLAYLKSTLTKPTERERNLDQGPFRWDVVNGSHAVVRVALAIERPGVKPSVGVAVGIVLSSPPAVVWQTHRSACTWALVPPVSSNLWDRVHKALQTGLQTWPDGVPCTTIAVDVVWPTTYSGETSTPQVGEILVSMGRVLAGTLSGTNPNQHTEDEISDGAAWCVDTRVASTLYMNDDDDDHLFGGDVTLNRHFAVLGQVLCSDPGLVNITTLFLGMKAYKPCGSTLYGGTSRSPSTLALMDAFGFNPFTCQFYWPYSSRKGPDHRCKAMVIVAMSALDPSEVDQSIMLAFSTSVVFATDKGGNTVLKLTREGKSAIVTAKNMQGLSNVLSTVQRCATALL